MKIKKLLVFILCFSLFETSMSCTASASQIQNEMIAEDSQKDNTVDDTELQSSGNSSRDAENGQEENIEEASFQHIHEYNKGVCSCGQTENTQEECKMSDNVNEDSVELPHEHTIVCHSNDDNTHTLYCSYEGCSYSKVEECEFERIAEDEGSDYIEICSICGCIGRNKKETHSESVSTNGYIVTVTDIPEGIYLKLNPIGDISEITSKLKERYGEETTFAILSAFDIELTDGENEWQPYEYNTSVEISVPIEMGNHDDIAVFRYDEEDAASSIAESDSLTKIEEHEYEDGVLSFETDHFSTFMIGSLSGDTTINSNASGYDYNASTHTLTLTNCSLTTNFVQSMGSCQAYYDGDLHIELNGTNAFSASSDYGIYVSGILTITGTGSLDISNIGTGIYAKKGIVINSGTITTRETGKGLYSDWGEININGGSVTSDKLIKTDNSRNISISDATVNVDKIESAGSLSSEQSAITVKGIKASPYTIDGGSVTVDATQDMGEMHNGSYLTLNGIAATTILNSGTLKVTLHDHDGNDYYTLDTGISKLTVNNGTVEVHRVSDDESHHCWDYGVGYLTVNAGTVTLDNCAVSEFGNMYVNGGTVTIRSSYGGASQATVTGGTVNATVTGSEDVCCFKVLSQSGGEVNIISSGVGVGRISDNSDYGGGLNLTAGTLTIEAGTYGVSTMSNKGYVEDVNGIFTAFPHMNFAGGEAYITGGIQALKYNCAPTFSSGAAIYTGNSRDSANSSDGYYGEKFIKVFDCYTVYEGVQRTNISDCTISAIKKITYSGKPYLPTPAVSCYINNKKVKLVNGKDYRIEYPDDSVNAGKKTLTVYGIGKYSGSKKASYDIDKKSISKLTKVLRSVAVGCSTDGLSPIDLYDGSIMLKRDSDYTYSLTQSDVSKKGTASVKVSAKETSVNYMGEVTVKVNVIDPGKKTMISGAEIKFDNGKKSYPYSGKAVKPDSITVTLNDQELTPKKDYTVLYKNNVKAGTAYAVVTGKGSYTGTVMKTYEIEPVKEPFSSITVNKGKNVVYNGKLQKPAVVVLNSNGKKLRAGTDYILEYVNNLNASNVYGDAEVNVTGIGNYAGVTGSKSFRIDPLPIKKAVITAKTYSTMTLKYAGQVLEKGVDYKIISEEKNGNKVNVTIGGLNNFKDSVVKKNIKR